MLNHEHERLVLVTVLLQPIDRFAHHGLRDVFAGRSCNESFGSPEIRRVIGSLTRQDVPEVIALGIRSEVPFSYDRCLIAAFLKELWKGLLVAIETVFVFHEPVEVRMLAGLDDGSAGSAEGVGHKAIVEAYALLGDTVEVRGGGYLAQSTAVSGDRLVGMVVRKNEDNVRPLFLGNVGFRFFGISFGDFLRRDFGGIGRRFVRTAVAEGENKEESTGRSHG